MNKVHIFLAVAVMIAAFGCGQAPQKQLASIQDLVELAEDVENAQATLTVDISDTYVAKIYISNVETDEYDNSYGNAIVVVFDRQTKQPLIRTRLEYISFTDKREFFRDEQEFFIYQDFNFDGINDIAFWYGNYGNYSSPAYQIYLATADGEFQHSEEFTELAHGLGMFDVNYDEKRLSTWIKSGCCWHQHTIYEVENNRPIAVHVWTRGFHDTYVLMEIEEKNRIDGRMVTNEYKVFDVDKEDNVIYSFEFSNQKKMRLFNYQNEHLFYIFTDKDDVVELFIDGSRFFTYTIENNSLYFGNGDTSYTITLNGIIVAMPSRTVEMQAEADTRKGSLRELINNNFENVLGNHTQLPRTNSVTNADIERFSNDFIERILSGNINQSLAYFAPQYIRDQHDNTLQGNTDAFLCQFLAGLPITGGDSYVNVSNLADIELFKVNNTSVNSDANTANVVFEIHLKTGEKYTVEVHVEIDSANRIYFWGAMG